MNVPVPPLNIQISVLTRASYSADEMSSPVSIRTAEKSFSGGTGTVDAAKQIGKLVGERAKDAGVDTVVFDRGGNRYHGRVAGIADGAREAGLTL